jgi:hypothetical protein
MSRKILITEILTRNLNNELAQAIVRLFKTKFKSIKCVLVLFLVVCICLSAYLTIQTCISYFSYEVITTSRTVFEFPMTFPKVTLCNLNPFTSEYSVEFLRKINKNLMPDFDVFDENQMSTISYENKSKLISDIFAQAFLQMNSLNFSDLEKRKLAHDFDDILLSCTFNSKNCSSNDFVWEFNSYYGNCYVFNSGFNSSDQNQVELRKTHVSNSQFGLKLALYVNFNQNLFQFSRGLGLLIKIENNSFLNGEDFRGMYISSGFQYYVAIDRHFKKNLPEPYSNCQLDNELSTIDDHNSELYKFIAHSRYQYTQQLCFLECLHLYTFKTCGCLDSSLFSLQNFTKCQLNKNLECTYNFFLQNYTQNNFINNYCLPLCPLECNQTEIKTPFTFNHLNGDILMDVLSRRINLVKDFSIDEKKLNSDRAKESVVRVNIFYDSLSYTMSTESPKMDVVSLLSNIGGNLGLFLGVSLISVCELIEALIEIFFAFRTK